MKITRIPLSLFLLAALSFAESEQKEELDLSTADRVNRQILDVFGAEGITIALPAFTTRIDGSRPPGSIPAGSIMNTNGREPLASSCSRSLRVAGGE
ncbi:MAG: hypothetical protein DRP64_11675 [Verrucomicrobia bacterium]|nr:MAG: hypothetical protein DRP64_11675 [Verrucomicrobiota bacterium]